MAEGSKQGPVELFLQQHTTLFSLFPLTSENFNWLTCFQIWSGRKYVVDFMFVWWHFGFVVWFGFIVLSLSMCHPSCSCVGAFKQQMWCSSWKNCNYIQCTHQEMICRASEWEQWLNLTCLRLICLEAICCRWWWFEVFYAPISRKCMYSM